jgi:hypothetical protein
MGIYKAPALPVDNRNLPIDFRPPGDPLAPLSDQIGYAVSQLPRGGPVRVKYRLAAWLGFDYTVFHIHYLSSV